MAIELPKAYDHKQSQAEWLAVWAEKKYFHPAADALGAAFAVVIPPPNVTGALHLGHALNNTLQDILVRWHRMCGDNTLWIPGADHAGIATQAVVERLILQTEKKTRRDLGRTALVERIWEWKEKYETRILGQLREMGSSCDFDRTRFTLDPMCARAVRETFFRMFRDGYIYRGKRLVNWDTQLQTSVADDETYTLDTKGGFWTFKYPVTGVENTFVSFSTTRPETMLGDSALCVHPSDDRYKHLVGKTVTLPLSGREIPIIADALLADPELGTGCVKVTPAHDPNDYACWQRNPHIEMINILNPDGTINAAGGEFAGLDRNKAREAVVKAMEDRGFYVGKEDRVIPLKYSDRSKSPIEPLLSDQWFVNMGDRTDGKPGLAQLAIDAVADGRVKFTPERYAKTYLDWLGEKRDWCVSRQLWWGHRIPVWSKRVPHLTRDNMFPGGAIPDGAIAYTRSDRDGDADTVRLMVCVAPGNEAVEHALEADGFEQDADVLDTWFSSALWPHSTLGWPDKTPDFEKYYPTSVLCTSRDIITLWVARMVLTGLYNTGSVPFRDVYIHPKVLDGFGQTMSKTTGNGVDPLDVIELYGTDALRYAMALLATETQDSRMPVANVCPHCGATVPMKQEHQSMRTKKLACPACKQAFRPGGPWPADDPELQTAKQGSDRFELGRNFANKLWNATRFILMNLDGYTPAEIRPDAMTTEDRWIVSRLATTTEDVTKALEAFRFADVAKIIYDFAWSEFCDWYIEMSKSRRSYPNAQRVLLGVLDGIIRLIHPVMPFVSESLWKALNEAAPVRGLPSPRAAEEHVCVAAWPTFPAGLADAGTEARIARMQDLVRGIREVRNRYQVDDKTKLDVAVRCNPGIAAELNSLAAFITGLGGVGILTCGPDAVKPKQGGGFVRTEYEAFVSLEGLIDVAAEVKRLEKQIAEKQKLLDATAGKLANEGFVSRAPADVIAQQRGLVAELEANIRTMTANMEELQAG